MTSVKHRVKAAAGAHIVGQALNVAYQLIGVPIFLWAWGTERYGEWLLLTTVPSVLSMSNTSFSSAAASEMAMRSGQGDHTGARTYFQAAYTIVALMSVVVFGASLLLFFVPDKSLSFFRTISPRELRFIGIALTFQVTAVQLLMLFDAAFRSNGEAARGIHWINAYHLFPFIGCITALSLFDSVVAVAATIATCQIAVVAASRADLWRKDRTLTLRLAPDERDKLAHLLLTGIAYTAFSIATVVRNQGVLIILGIVTNPTSVVMFNAMRTLSNVAFQAIRTVQRAVLPELSMAYGNGDLRLVRRLHRRASQVTLLIAFTCLAGFAMAGKWVFLYWTSGKVPFERNVFICLLVAGVLASLWNAHLAVALAINAHRRQAMILSIATVVGLVACIQLVKLWGAVGASATLLVVDAAMCLSVIPHALSLTRDDWYSFARSHIGGRQGVPRAATTAVEKLNP